MLSGFSGTSSFKKNKKKLIILKIVRSNESECNDHYLSLYWRNWDGNNPASSLRHKRLIKRGSGLRERSFSLASLSLDHLLEYYSYIFKKQVLIT